MLAEQELFRWSENWKELDEKATASRTSWLLAADVKAALSQKYPLPSCSRVMTVIATDGSQIFPDRHEFADCYLINIGSIVLHYGTGERPSLTNQPTLFYRGNEFFQLWNEEQFSITSEIVSAQRGILEIQELVALVEDAAMQQRTAIGLTDGTLILWKLADRPQQFQRNILQKYLVSFDRLYEHRVPFMGYISRPGSADVINLLRVGLCPENPTNCDRCPYKGKGEELPCEPIEGVTDAEMFSKILRKGERSSIFKSSSAILDHYRNHKVYFFYLHAGAEIARIEVPQWIAQNSSLLDFTHAAAYDQAQKGQGYPISLAEAHEQAIVRGNEREQFYRLLEQLYVHQGLEVSVSRKFLRKRNVGI